MSSLSDAILMCMSSYATLCVKFSKIKNKYIITFYMSWENTVWKYLRRWETNIKIFLKEVRCEEINWNSNFNEDDESWVFKTGVISFTSRYNFQRYESLSEVSVIVTVFQEVAPCSLVDGYRQFSFIITPLSVTPFFSLALQPQFGPWPTSMKLSLSLRFSRS
jgi:hypothetical protein